MDLNGDGNRDLIFGGQSPIRLHYYTGDSNGDLTSAGYIENTNGSPISAHCIIEGVFVDWNNDGLLDLIVGQRGFASEAWPIKLYINGGTQTEYRYSDHSEISLRGTNKCFGYHHIDVKDMDLDGKKDFVICARRRHLNTGEPEWCGSFFKNINTDDDPKFRDDDLITSEGDILLGDWGPMVDVADWNNDGAWDLILGKTTVNRDGIQIYLGKPQVPITIEPSVKQTKGIMNAYVSNNAFVTQVSLDKAGRVQLQVLDIKGRVFKSADYGKVSAGSHRFEIGHTTLTSGVYYINCLFDDKSFERRQVVVIK